jgi:hypothetical protein
VSFCGDADFADVYVSGAMKACAGKLICLARREAQLCRIEADLFLDRDVAEIKYFTILFFEAPAKTAFVVHAYSAIYPDFLR